MKFLAQVYIFAILFAISSAQTTAGSTQTPESGDSWSEIIVSGNGNHVIAPNGSTQIDYFNEEGDTKFSKLYTENDSLSYIGTIQGEDKVILVNKNGSDINLEINFLENGWTLDTEVDLSSSGIWDGYMNLGSNSAGDNVFIFNDKQVIVVDIGNLNQVTGAIDILQQGCTISENDISDTIIAPFQGRLLVYNENQVCIYNLDDGVVTEKMITPAGDYQTSTPFGDNYIAFSSRTDKKLYIHDYMNDVVVKTYTFSSQNYVDYPAVSGNGRYLLGPRENDYFVILDSQNLCNHIESTVMASVNKVAINNDMTKVFILDDNITFITVDKSNWETFDGCTASSSIVDNGGGTGEENQNQGSVILFFNIALVMIIALLC